MSKTIRPAIKCHGGKYYLAKWIIENFPKDYENMSYIEPFCGGASVLFNKKPSKFECINDSNFALYCIYLSLKLNFAQFISKLLTLEYSESTFELYKQQTVLTLLAIAVKEFVLRRMSRGGLKKSFAWSNRIRGGKPGDVNGWETALDNLETLSERLGKVNIFYSDAIKL
jgi:site-specific DNA-adenine methylase